jgi:hypothetical protein
MHLKDGKATRTCKMREHYDLLDHTFFERLLYLFILCYLSHKTKK